MLTISTCWSSPLCAAAMRTAAGLGVSAVLPGVLLVRAKKRRREEGGGPSPFHVVTVTATTIELCDCLVLVALL